MISRISDNIYSPLGRTSEENYLAVKSGKTGLSDHGRIFGVESNVTASLIEDSYIEEDWRSISDNLEYTKFEKLLILSISEALHSIDIDPRNRDVIFIISSTKGNIDYLTRSVDSTLGTSAVKVADYFGNPNVPVVVSNACISGVAAQITAMRLLESGAYRYAIVSGCDVQSRFIISGFQSFKALSTDPCKPFDKDRKGLNLGEAAATIIYSKDNDGAWYLLRGAIRNDANHISGPSRTGEGCYRALKSVIKGMDINEIGLVNAHGTATAYNDEMESIAIGRAGLIDLPVNALKGYYGHTMGAAGVLETIISMKSIDDNTIIGTKGYSTTGVSNEVNISPHNRSTVASSFIKMLSGFGGCNAAILMQKGGGIVC